MKNRGTGLAHRFLDKKAARWQNYMPKTIEEFTDISHPLDLDVVLKVKCLNTDTESLPNGTYMNMSFLK